MRIVWGKYYENVSISIVVKIMHDVSDFFPLDFSVMTDSFVTRCSRTTDVTRGGKEENRSLAHSNHATVL